MTKRVWIPRLADDYIRGLAERIRPLVRFVQGEDKLVESREGDPYTIEPKHIFNMAYNWDPKPVERITEELVPLRDITTYHAYGYYQFFKPSVAEVLAQIPEDLVDRVAYFEIVWEPETAADLRGEAVKAGFHEARTRLYAVEER